MKKRQELNITVVTTGDSEPIEVVSDALRAGGVTVEDVEAYNEVQEVPEVNKQRLIRLAAWAAGEDAKRRLGLPNEWWQASYFTRLDAEGGVDWGSTGSGCGTACCIAGKVAQEDGAVPKFDGYYTTAEITLPDGTVTTAHEYARQALGLTSWQSSDLFGGSNDLEDVLRVVARLVGTEVQD